MRWWHKFLGHTIEERRGLSTPLWDPFAKGILYKCSCGKHWAK